MPCWRISRVVGVPEAIICVDQVTDRAAKAGAQVLMPAGDIFWGDRTSLVADPEGNKVMLATHKSEPTAEQMDAAMKQMMTQGAS